jgi:adenylylsulfate kinase
MTTEPGHIGKTVHLYGYPCSGKTTLGKFLSKEFKDAVVLDGDEVRKTLSKGLGFSTIDRIEHHKRIGSLANLINKQGYDVIVCTVAPHPKCRMAIKQQVADYTLILVDTPISMCRRRDTKGLYRQALKGTIKNFTGVNSFITKGNPDLIISPDLVQLQCRKILQYLA